MGWHKQRTVLDTGEKTILKSIPINTEIPEAERKTYFIIPRKFSTSEFEKLSIIKKNLNLDEKGNPEIDEKFRDFAGFLIEKGVKDHNLDDDHGTKISLADPEVQKELIDCLDVATEIIKLVSEFNRPLAPKSAENSQTSQSGSTTEKNLPLATPSLTEQTPVL